MQNSTLRVKEQDINSWKKISAKVKNQAIGFIYPPICIHCYEPIVEAQSLCATCWSRLRAINEPLCPVLGLPFAVDLGPDALCAQAIANPPIFDRARSAFIYSDIPLAIISMLKYGDRPELARFCARLMANILAPILTPTFAPTFEDSPIIIPVPLHWTRQWSRRYNQSTEIAHELATICQLDMEIMLVKRIKRTKRQVGLSSLDREKNTINAFEAVKNANDIIKGRRVIIVDDVITTGATLNGVAKALRKIGVKKIDVISFARVVVGSDNYSKFI